MKTFFTSKTNSKIRPIDLLVKKRNTEKYGSKRLIAVRPKIWNELPKNVKKKHPLENSRNILNRGQTWLVNAKYA